MTWSNGIGAYIGIQRLLFERRSGVLAQTHKPGIRMKFVYSYLLGHREMMICLANSGFIRDPQGNHLYLSDLHGYCPCQRNPEETPYQPTCCDA